jgi:tRNA (guanine-N(7)-)-methyltransferase
MSQKNKKQKSLVYHLLGIIYRNGFYKFIKKIYFKYLSDFRIMTVSVRGRIEGTNLEFKNKYYQDYNIELSGLNNFLVNSSDNVLEIGFGDGEHVLAEAKKNTDKKYIAVELYELGCILLAKKLYRDKLNNVKIIKADARVVIEFAIKNSVKFNSIYVLFPDPWRKARHNKRRLVKKEFIQNLGNILAVNGRIIIATDWADYASDMERDLQDFKFIKLNPADMTNIVNTSFARRAVREGREISIWSGCVCPDYENI